MTTSDGYTIQPAAICIDLKLCIVNLISSRHVEKRARMSRTAYKREAILVGHSPLAHRVQTLCNGAQTCNASRMLRKISFRCDTFHTFPAKKWLFTHAFLPCLI